VDEILLHRARDVARAAFIEASVHKKRRVLTSTHH
jgi:hypothetical protein